MNRRTVLKGGIIVAATAHTLALAPVVADPLLDLINAYKAGMQAYADHPHFGNANDELAFCEKAFDWAINDLEAWEAPAKSREGAIAAIGLAKHALEDYDNGKLAYPMIAAALGYFEANPA